MLTFPTPPADITYSVEASTDLATWSSSNVTVQPSGNQTIARYPLPASGRAFLHVVLSPTP